MTDIKLPLRRYDIDIEAFTCKPISCAKDIEGHWFWHEDVLPLERAYAELQERCAKAEKERDEAYAALTDARAAAASAAKVHASQVAELTRLAENWEASHAGQERNTLAFLDDLERVTKERDEARARRDVLQERCTKLERSEEDHLTTIAQLGDKLFAVNESLNAAQAELAKVKAAYIEGLGSCTCGCPDDAHEFVEINWRECGKDGCECQPCSPAVAAVVAQLRSEVERLKYEAGTDGPAYNAGRSEGRADVCAELRDILDPGDANRWNKDGLLKEVEQLKRIKAAQEAWERIDPVKHGDSYTDACGDPSYVAAEIGAGRGPDGEVKP